MLSLTAALCCLFLSFKSKSSQPTFRTIGENYFLVLKKSLEWRFLNSEKILCFSNDYARFFCYESRQLRKRVKDWRLSFYYWFYVKYLRAGLYPNHINFYQISHTFMITAYFNQITPFLHRPPSTNASFWRIIIFKNHLDRFALKNNFYKAKTIELLETVHLSDS